MNIANHIDPAIDMGLSVKWAPCNIGANTPEGSGKYYAWGEVGIKTEYSWHTYRWSKDEYDTQLKYNTKSEFGIVDSKISLEQDDDVANMLLGGKWRIPSLNEWHELFEKCKWQPVRLLDVNGYLVTSNINGGQLFFPFSGFRYADNIGDVGKFGMYWSSSLNPNDPDQAWSADLWADGHKMFPIMRYRGYTIRPVMSV